MAVTSSKLEVAATSAGRERRREKERETSVSPPSKLIDFRVATQRGIDESLSAAVHRALLLHCARRTTTGCSSVPQQVNTKGSENDFGENDPDREVAPSGIVPRRDLRSPYSKIANCFDRVNLS